MESAKRSRKLAVVGPMTGNLDAIQMLIHDSKSTKKPRIGVNRSI